MSPSSRFTLVKNTMLLAVGFLLALLITHRGTEQPAAADVTGSAAKGTEQVLVVPQAGRSGFDPLAVSEIDQARAAGLAAYSATRGKVGLNPAAPASQQLEVVKVERHEENKATYAKGAWDRRADVLVYDYGRDALIVMVVNLSTGKVDDIQTVKGVQPHPTDNETARALQLVLDNPQAGPILRGQYQQIEGTSLVEPKQITATGFVFFPDPTAQTAVLAADCGAHRCVQLFLSTEVSHPLAAEPIVDLSTGRLISMNK